MAERQTLREKLAKVIALDGQGDGVPCSACEQLADALLPIIRAHAAEVAKTEYKGWDNDGERIIEKLEVMD